MGSQLRSPLLALVGLLLPPSMAAQELERFVPEGKDPFDFPRGTVSVFGGTLATASVEGIEVRRRDPVGGWSDPVLIRPEPDASWSFGAWIELGRDVLFVADERNDEFGHLGGAVYVYEPAGDTWALADKLGAGIAVERSHFGTSMVVDGDCLAVGARQRDPLDVPGFVQVFERSGGAWIPGARIDGFDGRGVFGWDVDLQADTLMVAEPGDHSVHFFERGGDGEWALAASLSDSTPPLGAGVSLDRDQAAASASYTQSDDVCPPSEVRIFERDESGWHVVAVVAEPGAIVDQWFQQVRISGSWLFVSAREDFWYPGDGRVVAFENVGGEWQYSHLVDASTGVPGDSFGASIDLSEESLFVSAPDAYWTPPPDPFVYEFPWRTSDLVGSYCSCSSGPCGNSSGGGSGCLNSTGQGAGLISHGTTSVKLDDFQLAVEDLPPGRTVVFFMGGARVASPFGDGLRCVASGGTGLYRFPPTRARADLPTRLGPGLAAFSEAAFPPSGQLRPGGRWYFQAIYRDGPGPCGSGFNTTDAVEAWLTD